MVVNLRLVALQRNFNNPVENWGWAAGIEGATLSGEFRRKVRRAIWMTNPSFYRRRYGNIYERLVADG